MKSVCGESGDVNEETVAYCAAKLPSIINGDKASDIANGDETGLIFHALQGKALCLKGKTCSA
jgi:hypothetical protein